MAEVQFGTMNSTVRMTDSQSALSPEVFERIVAAVVDRVREELAHERRVDAERKVRPGASSAQSTNWE
jgi:hypothetical protein